MSHRIGELIRGLKRRKGITKKEVSRRLGVGTTTLDAHLSGVSSFTLGTLLRFADICKVKLSDILDDFQKSYQTFTEIQSEEINNEDYSEEISKNRP